MDRIPNEPLIRQRTQRGWSQRKVASEVGTSEKRVSEWERGTVLPSPFYQERLCTLFGRDAEELGFIRGATTTSLVLITEEHGMRERLDNAESIIDLSWEAWFASRPEKAAQEVLRLLPRLDRMRLSNGPAIHSLRAQELAIRAHGLLGAIYLDALQNDTALYHYVQAQAIAEEIHDTDQATTYLALIGDVLRRKDHKRAAIERMELACQQAEHASRASKGHILQLLAYTYADVGRGAAFERAISEATDMLAHTGEGRDTAAHEFIPFEIYEITGKANRDLGHPLKAIPYLELAEKSLAGQSVTPRWHALLEISRAQAFCDAGDIALGVDLAQRGFSMAAQCASPRQMNRVKKLLRKLEASEHRTEKRVGDLRELLYDFYLREDPGIKRV